MKNSNNHYKDSRDFVFPSIDTCYSQLFAHKQVSALLRNNELVENVLRTQLSLDTPFSQHLSYCAIDLFDKRFDYLKRSICNFIECVLTISEYNFGLKTFIDFKLPGHHIAMRVSIGNLIAHSEYPLNPFTGNYMPTILLDEERKLYLVLKTTMSIILPASIHRGVETGEAKAIIRHNLLPDYSDKIILALLNSDYRNRLYSLFDDNKYLDISSDLLSDIIKKAKPSPYAEEFKDISNNLVLFVQQEHVSFSNILYEKLRSLNDK